MPAIAGVLFDLGGVVMASPLEAIARYERDHGLPDQAINRAIRTSGDAGAWSRLERGELTLEAFRTACRGAERARRAAQDWSSGFDAILTLPAPGQAPRGLADTGSAVFNALWTQFYMPCLTLPAGSGPDGLPVGVQLVARRHADEALLQVALWVEHWLGEGERR